MSEFIGGPIRRNGGKSHIAKTLINHFPKAYQYAEPFFGAGGMYFSVPQGLYEVRSFNDIDNLVICFFKMLRDQPEELYRQCLLTPYADQELKQAFANKDNPELTEMEKARTAWIIGRTAFATHTNGWLYNNGNPAANDVLKSTNSKLSQLFDYALFLRGAQIHCKDAIDFINAVDGPDTFFYCDPPYVTETKATKVTYLSEFTDEDHKKLAARLHETKAKVAISGYPSELYNGLYGDWRRIDYQARTAMGTGRNSEEAQRTECLWVNYDPSLEIGQYRPTNVKAKTANEQKLVSILKRKGLVQ